MCYRQSLVLLAVFSTGLLLWGCGISKPLFVAKHEPWRAREERACLQSGYVRENPYLRSRAALGGPAPCGAIHPFRMSATSDGLVNLKPAAHLRCPMIPAIEYWIAAIVNPAARRYFGAPLAEIKVAASYSCRAINHVRGGTLSEHGHANALDISAFTLADGRRITVKRGWHGTIAERRFLRTVHSGACRTFTTVLGPNYNRLHHDHFHFDLARRRAGDVCK